MKIKKCKVCKNEFTPMTSLQNICSYACKVKKDSIKLESKKLKTKEIWVKTIDVLYDLRDTIWSKKVKEIAWNKCEICWNTQTLQSHHIFTRHSKSTRWDIDNGSSLCAIHHAFAHSSPNEFMNILKEIRWAKAIRLLEVKSNTILQINRGILDWIIEDLNQL